MNLPARNLTLLLFGMAITIATATGRYLDYVRPVMFWFLLAAGVITIVLAISGIVADSIRVRDDEGDAPHVHSHPGGHNAGWLMLPPVLLLLFCAPPALGPQAAQSSTMQAVSVGPSERGHPYPALPDGDAPAISLHEFTNRAVDDTAGTLNRTVTVTAYSAHLNGRPVLARMMIWCCVADARPLQIELAGTPALPPDGTWVTAVIRLQPGSAGRDRDYRPLADLISLRRVAQPSPPYDS